MDSFDELQPQHDDHRRYLGWFILESQSFVHKEKLFQLFLTYVRAHPSKPNKFIYDFNVFSQKRCLKFACSSDDSFMWCQSKQKIKLLSFRHYLADISHIEKLVRYLQKLRAEQNLVTVFQKEHILNFPTEPQKAFWNAYCIFIEKLAPWWQLSADQAAELVTRQSKMWPMSEEQFNQYFTEAHQHRLLLVLHIQSDLEKLFGKSSPEIKKWLNTKHVNFGNASAFALMASEEAGILIVRQNISLLLKHKTKAS